MAEIQCDYLVVGAGAAGCVVAGRLSESPDAKVVLVEAGSAHLGLLTKVPGTAFLASVSPKRNWNYLTEPIPALNNRQLRWSQGRLLGGSGSINGMLYQRGHSLEYDQWRQMGCVGWAFEDVLPFFRKSETNARGADRWHGDSGPIRIKRSEIDLPICDAFLRAAADAGYPIVSDLNADVAEGFGRFDTNIHQGRRVSTASAYVGPALNRKNFRLLTDATALRVIIEGGRATGVEIAQAGRKQTIRAEQEIVLCGGALNSPQLLMLSGIGPAEHLRQHGIRVAVDSPEVGRNLQNHPAYSLIFACSEPVTAYRDLNLKSAVAVGLRYAMARRGTLAESYVATGGFLRSHASAEVADSIVVMAPALVTRGGVGARIKDLFPDRHGFMVAVSRGRPLSRGRIELRSADPLAPARIFPNYFGEPEDMRALVRSVRIMREMMRGPSIRPLISAELTPGDVSDDPVSLEAEIRERAGTFFHPSGTCAMGSSPRAVVDPELRVRGVERLRVADASVMPAALNACTHGPTIMIGEKAAAMIEGSASGSPRTQALQGRGE